LPKQKWTEGKIIAIIQEARKAGRKAGEKQLALLKRRGPKWLVKDGKRTVGTMLDVCGGAWVVIDAKQGFYRMLRKMEKSGKTRLLRIYVAKNYRGGGMLSIFDMCNRQELSVNEACYKAVAKVLREHGVKVIGVHTYID